MVLSFLGRYCIPECLLPSLVFQRVWWLWVAWQGMILRSCQLCSLWVLDRMCFLAIMDEDGLKALSQTGSTGGSKSGFATKIGLVSPLEME